MLVTALVVAGVLMLLVPLPSVAIDVALSLQLAFAVLVVLVATRSLSADHVAIFPTLLVASTCMRLALNVSTTRLILARGDAGEVVRSFGTIAIADNLLAGAVLFLVVACAQLLVVTRGAERVAEVSARFSLDAMPGAQMAIDADVRAGFIDADLARRRRAQVDRQARFYGAMDGAMRFVKGDALVALIIALVNLLGGAVVGVAVHGMSASAALSNYLALAIGDGLAAQIPALLVAIAAGLAITRRAGTGAEPEPESTMAHGPRRAHRFPVGGLAICAGLFISLAIIPGLPAGPLAGTAGLLGVGWLWARGRGVGARAEASAQSDGAYVLAAPNSMDVAEPLVVELDRPLAELLDAGRPDGIFARMQLRELRDWLGERLGCSPPTVTVRAVEGVGGYRLLARGLTIDSAELATLIDPTIEPSGKPSGRPSGKPFGGDLDRARNLLEQRMRAALDRRAHELVDIQQIGTDLRHIGASQPDLLDAVVPGLLTRIELTALVRELVRGRVAFGDLAVLLHALVDAGADGPLGPRDACLARVRAALQTRISARYAPAGTLSAWRLDPFVEDTVRGALLREDSGRVQLALEPEIAADIASAVADAVADADRPAVVLVAADVRPFVAEIIDISVPQVVVLAPQELRPETRIHTVATIGV